MNKIYSIAVDEHFDDNLKLFAENLASNEEIIQTAVVPTLTGNQFIICTRKVENVDVKSRNLLLEEVTKRVLKK